MRKVAGLVILVIVAASSALASHEDEITLYDQYGSPTAYIAEDLTVYLWSGKPVAYLTQDSRGGFHIYGFNGKHLGSLVKGIVRDHNGDAVAGI